MRLFYHLTPRPKSGAKTRAAFNRFHEDCQGTMAVMFAASIAVLLVLAGFAVDFATTRSSKTAIDNAADAAVLAAVKIAGDEYRKGNADWKSIAEEAGRKDLEANLGRAGLAPVADVDILVEGENGTFRGKATYAASIKTRLLAVAGINSIAYSNTLTAEYAVPSLLDVHLLIDLSPSMGIGASLVDQQTLQTSTGCALACHYTTPGAGNNYAAARASGAMLRIDVVREAVRQFIKDLKDRVSDADQVRISIDGFSNQLIEIYPASTDLDAAYDAAQTIDLTNLDYNEGTNIAHSLNQLVAKYPVDTAAGEGQRRKSRIILLSDGIENSSYGLPSGTPGVISAEIMDPNFVLTTPALQNNAFETIQTIDDTTCDAAKAAGHEVLTAHVEYLIPPAWNAGSVPRFSYIENTLAPKSKQAFLACASNPSLAFEASSTQDVLKMFERITEEVLSASQLRLTN